MIAYKLDNPTRIKADQQIAQMGEVLAEIAPTLRILRGLINEHKTTISGTALGQYRDELQSMVNEAISLTHTIAKNAIRLSKVSDLAANQLSALEIQIAESLKARDMESITPRSQTNAIPNRQEPTRISRVIEYSRPN